jgi:L-cysteine S-thiosulfotransferase
LVWISPGREEDVMAPALCRVRRFIVAASAGVLLSIAAASADTTDKELEKYRQMLQDPFANPGNLWVDRGEELWNLPGGPKKASLQACDLGKGVGKLEGAFAELPRYFADADRVMDLEARLLWCMSQVQGRDPNEVLKTKFSPMGAAGETISALEAVTAFVASKSNGMKLAAALDHPKEQEMVAVGEMLFYRHQGPWDFSCATCHGDNGKRIRLQELPNFAVPQQAQAVLGSWPAYRVSQESVRTMQHRLYDCFWQMRLPAVDYASDVTIALTAYLTKKAEGGLIQVPSVKR